MSSPKHSNNLMENGTRRLLFSHTFLYAGMALYEIFLNLFIWKLTADISAIAWFNIIRLVSHCFFFVAAAWPIKHGREQLVRKAGLFLFGAVFLMLFLLGDGSLDHLPLIATMLGASTGMYWIAYHQIRFDLTTARNRGNYTGIEFGSKSLVEILVPYLGGLLIALNLFGLGYRPLFFIGISLIILCIIIGSIKIREHTHGKLQLWKTYAIMRKDKNIMKNFIAYILSGFGRTGALEKVIIPLFIFSYVESEYVLGGWLSAFSIIAILFSLFVGRTLGFKHYTRSMLAGGLIYFILILLLIQFPSLTMFIIFGAGAKLMTVLIQIPKRVISDNVVHFLDDYRVHRTENIVIRELFNVGIGRMASWVVLLFIGSLISDNIKIVLGLMALAVLAETLILVTMKFDQDGIAE